MSKSVAFGFGDKLVDNITDHGGMVFNTDDIVALCHDGVELSVSLSKEGCQIVHFSKLSNCLKEFISRATQLRLEEGEPEDLGVDALGEEAADLLLKVVVDDVLDVNCVKIVSPWVKDLEAFVLDVLFSVSFDIIPEELESGLVGLDWVGKIVLGDVLLVVSQEAADCLDAGGTLEVLGVDQFVKDFLKLVNTTLVANIECLNDSHECAFEALHVPVLIDDLVDDSALENLGGLVSKQKHNVMHLADLVAILNVFGAPLW